MIILIVLQQEINKNTLLSMRQICSPNWQPSTTTCQFLHYPKKQVTIKEQKNRTSLKLNGNDSCYPQLLLPQKNNILPTNLIKKQYKMINYMKMNHNIHKILNPDKTESNLIPLKLNQREIILLLWQQVPTANIISCC